ncbi:MAG: DUF58 domain-containing protein [Alcanivoracaceae bacterium]|nr:DUF58 domain-containing protein [Alcanivoracaceae bacterium]
MMLRAAPRLIRLTLLLVALSGLPLVARVWLPEYQVSADRLWLSALLLWGLLILVDIIRGLSAPTPNATRLLPAAFSVQRKHTIRLQFVSKELPPLAELADHHPADDGDTGLPAQLRPGDGSITQFCYQYRPAQRGHAHFGDIELWLPGPLGLVWQRRRVAAAASVPVYPDFSMLTGSALLAQQDNHLDSGQRLQQRRGEGMEFHQLREYRDGDVLRQIDWKASARRHTLISREYQEDQNQHIIVLLDGGARLAMPVNGLSGFDHALNAALLLSWSAIKHSDKPGIMLFSNDTERWLPPRRGQQGINRLLSGLYTLQPGNRASDYSSAARKLLGRWHKHALLVLISRIQPDDEQELMNAVKLLGSRHLLMIADIQLPAQENLRRSEVNSLDTAFKVSADAAWQDARDALHTRLRHAGAMLVTSTPEQLPAQLNQVYLALKRSGRL